MSNLFQSYTSITTIIKTKNPHLYSLSSPLQYGDSYIMYYKNTADMIDVNIQHELVSHSAHTASLLNTT